MDKQVISVISRVLQGTEKKETEHGAGKGLGVRSSLDPRWEMERPPEKKKV